jgi:hypothetical protein
MLGALLLLMTAIDDARGSPTDALPVLVKPEVAVARVATCGLGTAKAAFDAVMQEEVVSITGVASASDEQLECVARASLDTFYYVTVPRPIEDAYRSRYFDLSRERGLQLAREWLQQRGLLERLPAYNQQKSDEPAFIRQLETLCGPKAEGAVKSLGGMGTFNLDVLASRPLDEETHWCLVNAAIASGYPFGFIGNEQYGTEP